VRGSLYAGGPGTRWLILEVDGKVATGEAAGDARFSAGYLSETHDGDEIGRRRMQGNVRIAEQTLRRSGEASGSGQNASLQGDCAETH
jgi:hypothetical protein